MSEPLVKVRTHRQSGTIVLNRPEKRNALSRDVLHQLRQALDDLRLERKIRAVILTGSDSAFCSGLDLAEMQQTSRQDDVQQRWHEDAVLLRDVLMAMLRFPKPIIAAVNGPAAAGGAGLILASDIVVGTPEATFSLPDPRRGLVAGSVAPLLVYRIGASRAANLLLRAHSIDAQQSLDWGLLHEIVPNDLVWARSAEIAGECAESAAEALQLTKRSLNETIGEYLEIQLTLGAAADATARTTEAAAEGIAAFLEKRPPEWP